MLYFIRQIIKCRIAIYFIFSRFIKIFCIIRVRGVDVLRFNHPNTYSFHSSCINISCVFDCHLRISCVQAAYMFMIQSLFAANKNFPKRSIAFGIGGNNISISFFLGNVSVIIFSLLEVHSMINNN